MDGLTATELYLTLSHSSSHTLTPFLTNRFPPSPRLWISPPNERPLPEVYEDIYGGPLTVGNRGGIHVADTLEHIVLEAE